MQDPLVSCYELFQTTCHEGACSTCRSFSESVCNLSVKGRKTCVAIHVTTGTHTASPNALRDCLSVFATIGNESGTPCKRAYSRAVRVLMRIFPLPVATKNCLPLPPTAVRRQPAMSSDRTSALCPSARRRRKNVLKFSLFRQANCFTISKWDEGIMARCFSTFCSDHQRGSSCVSLSTTELVKPSFL